jgi:hypothetical protein
MRHRGRTDPDRSHVGVATGQLAVDEVSMSETAAT